jgi:hypothetical protein
MVMANAYHQEQEASNRDADPSMEAEEMYGSVDFVGIVRDLDPVARNKTHDGEEDDVEESDLGVLGMREYSVGEHACGTPR